MKKTKKPLREFWVVGDIMEAHLEPFEPIDPARLAACEEDGVEFIHVREVQPQKSHPKRSKR